MLHGIDAYFLERTRFERRVSGFIVGVGATVLAGLFGLYWLIHSPSTPAFVHDIPILRWGFEGGEQYVRHIELKTLGMVTTNPGLQAQYIPASRRGGSHVHPGKPHPNAKPEFRSPRDEQGDAETDRLARARARIMNVALVRSEDLVIERLVKPEYPMDARERGIEGKVAVMALIDTLGDVMSVEVMGQSENHLLERAAEEAVWKCRFRPYSVNGRVQRVYAMFRFSFRLE